MMGRLSALRHRDFALLWSANIVSRIGTQMRDLALGWQIYLLTESPVALGLLGAARVLPMMVLALGGGVAADALDRRRMLIATQSVLALTSVGMALATRGGWASPTLLYALLGMASAATAFDNPARQALVVNLLPKRDLANGLTLGILGWQTATVVGPAVGGVLLAAASVEAIYWVDAGSFLAVIGALLALRSRSTAEVPGERRGQLSFRAALDGLQFLRGQRVLVWLMFVDFFATFFAGSMMLMPIFADRIFGVGEEGLGLLASAPAVGSLLASGWMSTRPAIKRQGAAVLGAVVCYGASIALFGVTTSFPLALVLLAISGAADTVSTVVRQLVRHTLTPDRLRGRMTSINMMFVMSGPQLGEVEAGLIAAAFSARISVVSGGLACIVVALLVGAAVPRIRLLRKAPDEEPAPLPAAAVEPGASPPR
jgi:MFS family permease